VTCRSKKGETQNGKNFNEDSTQIQELIRMTQDRAFITNLCAKFVKPIVSTSIQKVKTRLLYTVKIAFKES